MPDTGTFLVLQDSVSGANILYFNYGQYFADGVNGKCAYSVTIQGNMLQLGFCSAAIDFFVAPVLRFKKS